MTERKNIWELQHTTICKVVGMALELEDLKRVLRKFRLRIPESRVDEEFSFHSVIVRMCGEESKIARHVQKLIEKRYSRYANRLVQQDSAELAELVLKGDSDFDVPLWAIVWFFATRHHANGEEIQTALFALIHMLEHRLVKDFWKKAGSDHQKQEADHREEIGALKKDYIKLQSSHCKLEKENRRLTQRLVHSGPDFRASSPQLIANNPICDHAHIRKLSRLKALLEEARNRNRELEKAYSQSRKQIEILTAELLIHEDAQLDVNESLDKACPCRERYCLKGKRIAMVGGIDSLEVHYKKLVEQSGGEFCRHDGRSCRGERRLEDCIRNADLVVCPITVNSHFGANGVKKVCRRFGISCCFPDSAGLACLRGVLVQHFTPDRYTAQDLGSIRIEQ